MGIYGCDVSKTEWPKLVVTMNKSYLKNDTYRYEVRYHKMRPLSMSLQSLR